MDRAKDVFDTQIRADIIPEDPGLLPLKHHSAEGLVVAPALPTYLLVLLLTQLVQGPEEDRGALEVFVVVTTTSAAARAAAPQPAAAD